MPSERSRPQRTATPSMRKQMADTIARDISAQRKKPAKPAATRRSSIRVPTPPPDTSFSDEIEEEPMPPPSQ